MNEKEENNESTDEKNLRKNNDFKEKDIIENNQLSSQKEKSEENLREGLILELEKKIALLEKRERDNILRLKAEMENIRRRNEQEIIKIHKFALENFIMELLPVIDNLERTLKTMHQKNNKLDVIITGLELILKSFLETMKKFGINIIEQVDVPFNPEIHQAMAMSESNTHKSNNHVVEILQKGYVLNGRLMRPAMVTVSVKKENTTQ